MASVRKRTWGTPQKEAWIVDYKDQAGKRRFKQFERKKDADAYRRQVEDEVGRGVHTPERQTTGFADLADAYILECERRWKAKDLAGNTFVSYSYVITSHLLPKFNAIKLTALTSEVIQSWLDDMMTTDARVEVKRRLVVLNQMLTFAVAKNWLARNPLVDRPVKIRGGKHRTEIAIPTKDEMHTIFETLAKRDKRDHHLNHRNLVLIVTLGAFTGLRCGEICGLQWENIDWDADEIDVKWNLSKYDGLKGPKSFAGIRRVPMVPSVKAALLRHASSSDGATTGFVLQSQTRRFAHVKPNGSLSPRPSRSKRHKNVSANYVDPNKVGAYFWPKLLRDANVVDEDGQHKYHFHCLRHFHVSLLIEHGLSAFYISKIIGHSNVATTLNKYGHLFPSDRTARLALETVATQFVAPEAPIAAIPYVPKPSRDDDKERVLELSRQGVPHRKIAAQLGLPHSTVFYWIHPERMLEQDRRRKAKRREAELEKLNVTQMEHGAAKSLN